jgi:hypothetical protein
MSSSRANQSTAGPSNPMRGTRFQNEAVNDNFLLFMEQQKVDNSAKDVKITGLTTEIGRVSGQNEIMLKEINRMTKMVSDFLGAQRSATPASLSDVEFAPAPTPAHRPGPGPAPAPRPRQNVPDDPNPVNYVIDSKVKVSMSCCFIFILGTHLSNRLGA